MGEVLFDCFPGGENVLGGAPFNVAWHLQSLGATPLFISRVGRDVHGDEGVLMRTTEGEFHCLRAEKVAGVVDTIGAGDAFSAVYIHGLRSGWPVDVTLRYAQNFAARVIGLRGATTFDHSLYKEFITSLPYQNDNFAPPNPENSL